jgi:cell division septum initiation protein DivIVA
MDWNDIDRLRDPGFTLARRGYERREVDRLLGALVDWLETDAAEELGDLTAKRRLEYVGKSTTRILLTTQEESAQLRRETRDECAQLRSQAHEDAREVVEAASATAEQIVAEGRQRRAEIEAIVSELEALRDRTLQELERLRTELDSMLETYATDAPSDEGSAAQAEPATAPDAVARA